MCRTFTFTGPKAQAWPQCHALDNNVHSFGIPEIIWKFSKIKQIIRSIALFNSCTVKNAVWVYTLQPRYNTVIYCRNSDIAQLRLGSHCLYFLCIKPSFREKNSQSHIAVCDALLGQCESLSFLCRTDGDFTTIYFAIQFREKNSQYFIAVCDALFGQCKSLTFLYFFQLIALHCNTHTTAG